jgi:hypothetical protein
MTDCVIVRDLPAILNDDGDVVEIGVNGKSTYVRREYIDNRPKKLEAPRTYYEKNRDKILQWQKAYSKQYYEEHKEMIKEKQKIYYPNYYQATREKQIERAKKNYAENREEKLQYFKERYAQKKAANPNWTVNDDCKSFVPHDCPYCGHHNDTYSKSYYHHKRSKCAKQANKIIANLPPPSELFDFPPPPPEFC